MEKNNYKYWTCKDGRKIKIKDLTISHIKNIIKFLKKRGFITPSILEFYLTCSRPNGEMAQLEFERECNAVFSSPITDWIEILENELKRREINVK